MAPEYGATCGIFPIDDETLRYLRFTGRAAEQVALVEAYAREQGLFHDAEHRRRTTPSVAELDLGQRRAERRRAEAAAGSRQPVPDARSRSRTRCPAWSSRRRRTPASSADAAGQITNVGYAPASTPSPERQARLGGDRRDHQLHQHLEPVGDGGRRPAGQEGGRAGPHDQALGEDLAGAGLEGGHRVPGRGGADAVPRDSSASTSSATAARPASATPARCRSRSPTRSTARDLVVASVLSGNRNFEGRINPDVRANYLMSPPLVVAYALAGRIDIDLDKEPLGEGTGRRSRSSCGTSGRRPARSPTPSARRSSRRCSRRRTPSSSRATSAGASWTCRSGETYALGRRLDLHQAPAVLRGHDQDAGRRSARSPARACWRCSATASPPTTSRPPAPSRRTARPASTWSRTASTAKDFNSYGARRGNHEVMVRGTFANVRLKNLLAPGTEGGVTRHLPDGAVMSIFDASREVRRGEGAARRSWPARSTARLVARLGGQGAAPARRARGDRRELRAHPPQQPGRHGHPAAAVPARARPPPRSASPARRSSRRSGCRRCSASGFAGGRELDGARDGADGNAVKEFPTIVRIDTPQEIAYYQHGGILHYVLRQLAGAPSLDTMPA